MPPCVPCSPEVLPGKLAPDVGLMLGACDNAAAAGAAGGTPLPRVGHGVDVYGSWAAARSAPGLHWCIAGAFQPVLAALYPRGLVTALSVLLCSTFLAWCGDLQQCIC